MEITKNYHFDAHADVWIVDPWGNIKDLRITPVRSIPFLEVLWSYDKNRRPIEAESIEIRPKYYKAGYRFLRECYEEEGWPEGFEAYTSYINRAKSARIRDASTDEHLPEYVITRRNMVRNPDVAPPSAKKPKKVASK